MRRTRFGIVIFPGSNCDQDCVHVLDQVLHQEVRQLWHQTTDLESVDAIILPGGFSYGDYLRTGAVACQSPIMQSVIRFAKRGGLVIGICNGFQILLEAGLLPGAMLRNAGLRFVCQDVCLRVETTQSPCTAGYHAGQVIRMPIAHGEGNYVCDKKTLETLQKNKQILLRYTDNPNGSADDIAGIMNKKKTVFGLMPHPERASESILGSEDGRKIFESMIQWIIVNQ